MSCFVDFALKPNNLVRKQIFLILKFTFKILILTIFHQNYLSKILFLMN